MTAATPAVVLLMDLQHGRVTRVAQDLPVVTEFLTSHRLFSHLPQEVLARAARSITVRTYRRGHQLWHAGDPANYVCIVHSGLVVLTDLDPSGNQCVVLRLTRGDAVGLGAVLHTRRWGWTASALIDSTVLLVDPQIFYQLYLDHPDMAHRVVYELYSLAYRSQRAAARLALTSVPARLAACLLELAGDGGDVFECELRLSRHDLGILVSASRETVTRELARWSRRGVVELSAHGLRILCPEILRELADASVDGKHPASA